MATCSSHAIVEQEANANKGTSLPAKCGILGLIKNSIITGMGQIHQAIAQWLLLDSF